MTVRSWPERSSPILMTSKAHLLRMKTTSSPEAKSLLERVRRTSNGFSTIPHPRAWWIYSASILLEQQVLHLSREMPLPRLTVIDPRKRGHNFAPLTPVRAALPQTAPLVYPTPAAAASLPRSCSAELWPSIGDLSSAPRARSLAGWQSLHSLAPQCWSQSSRPPRRNSPRIARGSSSDHASSPPGTPLPAPRPSVPPAVLAARRKPYPPLRGPLPHGAS